MSKRRRVMELVYFAFVLILVLAMLYSLSKVLFNLVYDAPERQEHPSKTVIKDGVAYFPRQDVTVVLVMGIDQYGKAVESGSYNNHGAADMVMLMIFDDLREVCDILYLNRDTMLKMPVLGVGGKPAGYYYGQLALSHTYGAGMKDSCENTRQAVSDFLMGIQIDYYVAMNMDAISILTDAVDGVTVEVTEDFSQVDPSIGMGLVTLRGEQAINYVRTRKDVGDQLNLSRIERQKAFVESFSKAFAEKQNASTTFFTTTYESVSDYLVTDCTGTSLNALYQRYSKYTLGAVYTLEGENVMGEKYFEFYADEQKLESLTLQLFYAPKKS